MSSLLSSTNLELVSHFENNNMKIKILIFINFSLFEFSGYDIIRLIFAATKENSLPLFDYADIIWGEKNNSGLMNSLQTLENKAAKLILDLPPLSSATEALAALHWPTLSSRRYKHRFVFIYKCTNGLIDFDFNLRTNDSIHSYNTTSCENLHLPKANTNCGKHKPSYLASKDFNNLTNQLETVILCIVLSLY